MRITDHLRTTRTGGYRCATCHKKVRRWSPEYWWLGLVDEPLDRRDLSCVDCDAGGPLPV